MPRAAACRNGSWEVVVGIRISIMKEKRCDENCYARKGCANVLRFVVFKLRSKTCQKPSKNLSSILPVLLQLMDTAAEGDRARRADLLHQFCIWSRL